MAAPHTTAVQGGFCEKQKFFQMCETPAKASETSIGNLTLTPVRFLDSPKSKGDPNANLAACKTRLATIVNTLQLNYAKWRLAHTRGLALCTSIEAIKARNLETANTTSTKTDSSNYPQELKQICDKLFIITGIFRDICTNAGEALKQLRALSKLPGTENEVLHRTWQMGQFVEFAEKLVSCYEAEAKAKQWVMQEIAHCTTRADLIRCVCTWEYPQHVDGRVALMFAELTEELKSKS